ncbi:MAG: molecular chaperone DnaJ [Pseudarthrobacter sp.]|nr:molecular chaperone DnaJ [Pseudarthrobacter sp.]
MRSSLPDHYGTLGVPRTATGREISGAYRKFMRTHHPDIDSGATDRSELLRIMAAFAVLRNPTTRAAYDRELRGRQAPPPRSAEPPPEEASPPRSAPQQVPVRVVRRSAGPLFRVSPVRWESGPWAGPTTEQGRPKK